MQARRKVVGCGCASALVSGISALQNLERLEIAVSDSLGTIGKLQALTKLRTKFYRTRFQELRLENPKLQFLSVVGSGNVNTTVRGVAVPYTSVYLYKQHNMFQMHGRLLLAGWAHVAVLIQLDGASRATYK